MLEAKIPTVECRMLRSNRSKHSISVIVQSREGSDPYCQDIEGKALSSRFRMDNQPRWIEYDPSGAQKAFDFREHFKGRRVLHQVRDQMKAHGRYESAAHFNGHVNTVCALIVAIRHDPEVVSRDRTFTQVTIISQPVDLFEIVAV